VAISDFHASMEAIFFHKEKDANIFQRKLQIKSFCQTGAKAAGATGAEL
jgi:hypothetical protein